jgi:hypothetical protein
MRLSPLSKYIVLLCMEIYCSEIYSLQTHNLDTFDNLVGFTATDTNEDLNAVDGYDYWLCGITSVVTCATCSAKAFLSPGLLVLLPLGSCVFHVGYRAALYLTNTQVPTSRRSHTPYHELDTHSDSDEEIDNSI